MPLVKTGSYVATSLLRRHRRARRLRAPLCEQRVEVRRRDVVVELEVVLEARRAIARREALDLFVVELAVGRGLELADAELALDVVLERVGAAQHARQRPADLDDVLAHGLLEKQRIKGSDRFDLAWGEADELGAVAHGLGGDEAVLLLAELQKWDERGPR